MILFSIFKHSLLQFRKILVEKSNEELTKEKNKFGKDLVKFIKSYIICMKHIAAKISEVKQPEPI